MNSDIAREIAIELTLQGGFHGHDGLYTSRQQEEIICNNIQRAIDQSTAPLKAEIERLKREVEDWKTYGENHVKLLHEVEMEADKLTLEKDAEIEKLKHERNKAGVVERNKYLPKLAQLTLEKDAAESKCAEFQEYAKATEYWQIQPHDQKERRAWIERLSKAPSGNYVPAEKLKGVEELLERINATACLDATQSRAFSIAADSKNALTQLRDLKGGKEQ